MLLLSWLAGTGMFDASLATAIGGPYGLSAFLTALALAARRTACGFDCAGTRSIARPSLAFSHRALRSVCIGRLGLCGCARRHIPHRQHNRAGQRRRRGLSDYLRPARHAGGASDRAQRRRFRTGGAGGGSDQPGSAGRNAHRFGHHWRLRCRRSGAAGAGGDRQRRDRSLAVSARLSRRTLVGGTSRAGKSPRSLGALRPACLGGDWRGASRRIRSGFPCPASDFIRRRRDDAGLARPESDLVAFRAGWRGFIPGDRDIYRDALVLFRDPPGQAAFAWNSASKGSKDWRWLELPRQHCHRPRCAVRLSGFFQQRHHRSQGSNAGGARPLDEGWARGPP